MKDLYIASKTAEGGIYHYSYNGGSYELKSVLKVPDPMYMIEVNKKMHILLRHPFENKESGLVSCDILSDGTLSALTNPVTVRGEIACHLAEIDEQIYCVNYISGSVIRLPDKLVLHGENSHTHFVGETPDKKFVCVTDLGLDKIFIYDKSLNAVNTVKLPSGYGVRHLVFSEDGSYVFAVNELKPSVSVFFYENGEMTLLDTQSTLPEDFGDWSAAAAIRLYQDKIYVSNRGHDSIAELSFDGKRLHLEKTFSCGGKTPRDFHFQDNRLICANLDSDTVTVFEETKGEFSLVQELCVEKPLCVLPRMN